MSELIYPGINIQWPISQLILSGEKTIETRTYPLPAQYIGKKMIIIETPGKSAKFKKRAVGLIVFGECFQYPNESSFYNDFESHKVDKKSKWAWGSKNKWGWKIKFVRRFPSPIALKQSTGILYTKHVSISLSP